jgi:hypothetical protein
MCVYRSPSGEPQFLFAAPSFTGDASSEAVPFREGAIKVQTLLVEAAAIDTVGGLPTTVDTG